MADVLVTGAHGFIGGCLVPLLRAAGHRVTAVDLGAGDVADPATWSAFPAADVVVHLAGQSVVPESWREPETFLRGNVLGALGALGYCRERGSALVFPSTYLYGAPESLPVAEGAPLHPASPYALSKKLAEDACAFYARHFDVPVTVLRPFNVYGPGQSKRFLIPWVVEQVKRGPEIHVLDLEPKRDYIHVDDLAEVMRLVVERPAPFRVLNVGTGESHSVAEVVALLQELAGTDYPVLSTEDRRRVEVLDCRADVSAAARELDWRPRITLREGLRQVLDA